MSRKPGSQWGEGKLPRSGFVQLLSSAPRVHFYYISVRNCVKDEGRPLGAGLQEQASNHLKLRW
jgi:hypothetical protein